MSQIHIKQIRTSSPVATNYATLLYNGSSNTWSNLETGGLKIPGGTTAERPSLTNISSNHGIIRYNSTLNALEYYDNTGSWIRLSNVTKVTASFTNANLVANVYSFNHNLGTTDIFVAVYDNGNNLVYPTNISTVNSNTVDIDLTGFTPISGTWRVVAIG